MQASLKGLALEKVTSSDLSRGQLARYLHHAGKGDFETSLPVAARVLAIGSLAHLLQLPAADASARHKPDLV